MNQPHIYRQNQIDGSSAFFTVNIVVGEAMGKAMAELLGSK